MKKRHLYLFLLFMLTGCSTLNKTVIENTERSTLQPLVLIPEYDIYDIRIDIIRQTEEEKTDESETKDVEVPYHSVGFYLGNGLFIDLNDNLSLLVPKLFNIDSNENFKIKQNHPDYLLASTTTYEKIDSLFITKHEGLIETNTKKIITKKDSVVFVREGLISKYRITETDSTINYQSGLINKVIHKSKEGYFYKALFVKKEYKQTENEIFIGKKYILRNHGNLIEIFATGLLNGEYLKYRIIKSDDRMFVYDRFFRGLEIISAENEINIIKNTRNVDSYSIE